MSVLLTGSSGRLGTMLRTRLPALGWSLRCFDVAAPADGSPVILGSITSAHDLERAFDGVSAVIHLAGQPTEAPWEQVLAGNIAGCYELYEAARRAGVRRVVYASSNHAVGFTPQQPTLPVPAAPRPDTLYGVSKVFGEALGRYYVDRYGFTVHCLRIGTCADSPPDHRALSTWLSPDDLTRLVDAALRTSVRYSVVWGVSANTRRWWSLQEGAVIGYQPVDDAEAYAASLTEYPAFPSDSFVGGGFTTEGFGIDEVRARG